MKTDGGVQGEFASLGGQVGEISNFQESGSEERGSAIRKQRAQALLSQGLSVTCEASAVQYLCLCPRMVNYCSRCLIRQRSSCPESQGYLHFHSPPRGDEADQLRGEAAGTVITNPAEK